MNLFSKDPLPRCRICHQGTVLMECVLVLPILTAMIFAIVQFALVWNAHLMTHYAAYNAARAALVYNPSDYSENGVFFSAKGPCWKAAVETLAWVSSSVGDGGMPISGWGTVPSSSQISNQVRINTAESLLDSDSMPVIRMKVEFDFPLHVPFIGHVIAKCADPSRSDAITLHAYSAVPKPWSTVRYPKIPAASD